MKQTIKTKVNQLQHKIKTSDLKKYVETVIGDQPVKVQALMEIAQDVKGSELEGLPYAVAMFKSHFYSEKQIAEELNLPVKEVKRITRLPNFSYMVNQMEGAIWSDLILDAQAVIKFHLRENNDKDLAKWVLESTNKVNNPNKQVNLHQHNNRTLIVNPALGGQQQEDVLQIPTSVSELSGNLFNMMKENSSKTEPPISISDD
jgi:hypothetical protein